MWSRRSSRTPTGEPVLIAFDKSLPSSGPSAMNTNSRSFGTPTIRIRPAKAEEAGTAGCDMIGFDAAALVDLVRAHAARRVSSAICTARTRYRGTHGVLATAVDGRGS
jgi:hypothetical protein